MLRTIARARSRSDVYVSRMAGHDKNVLNEGPCLMKLMKRSEVILASDAEQALLFQLRHCWTDCAEYAGYAGTIGQDGCAAVPQLGGVN